MEPSNMEHNHDNRHEQPTSLRNLLLAVAVNGGIVAFELVFGLLIGSTALISDAVHNLSDIASMLMTYGAEKVSVRPANKGKTYGYRKIEFVSAFIHSIVLSVVIAFVFWAALLRLAAPPEIPGQEMLWVAVVAFVGNGVATLLLQKVSTRSFNMISAWLHSFQDALFSFAVIIGALLIIFFGWSLVDPLLSMGICLFVACEIYRIVRHSINSLLDAVPPGIDFLRVKEDLLAIPGVAEVNDLHVWETGTGCRLLSAHFVSGGDSPDHESIIRTAQNMLFKI